MKKKTKKKVKVIYVEDDGRTLYNMDGVRRQNAIIPDKITDNRLAKEKNKDKEEARLERKERHAAIRAGYATYLPILFGVLACFAVVAVAIYFWLK